MKNILFLIIQSLKSIVEIFYPGYYSPNCKAVKKIANNNKIEIKTVYDIGCFTGSWYVERNRTFPNSNIFYLFDAQNLLNKKILNNNLKFFNVVLGSKDDQEVKFWSDGNSGSSYFKELGNSLWDNIEPQQLKTITLKSFIEQNDLELPNYLKIDTQSSELEILKGFGNLIDNESLYFIELEISLYQINEGGPLVNEVIDFMNENDYVLVSVEQLPIVEYFNEKKLVQLNGIFAKRFLTIN